MEFLTRLIQFLGSVYYAFNMAFFEDNDFEFTYLPGPRASLVDDTIEII